jgi:hypothetical protein
VTQLDTQKYLGRRRGREKVDFLLVSKKVKKNIPVLFLLIDSLTRNLSFSVDVVAFLEQVLKPVWFPPWTGNKVILGHNLLIRQIKPFVI